MKKSVKDSEKPIDKPIDKPIEKSPDKSIEKNISNPKDKNQNNSTDKTKDNKNQKEKNISSKEKQINSSEADQPAKKLNIDFIFRSIIIFLLLVILFFAIYGYHLDRIAGQNQVDESEYYSIFKQQCSDYGGNWCNDQCFVKCSDGQKFICSVYGQSGCINQSSQLNYSFTSYTDQAPYYGAYCDKINPYDLNVRKAASTAIKNNSGAYSVIQLLEIYDWVKNNIEYQTVTSPNVPYAPAETLATASGDCKNQAVLIASMVKSIGGIAKVVADPLCGHAYALVYISNSSQDMESITKAIDEHYNQKLNIKWITSGKENWLIFDPAGGFYPGNTLAECSGERTVYYVNSCMDCAQEYPEKPYTFQGKCYSACPSGTVSVNGNACSACPYGEYSYKNKCVSCPAGYHLNTDGKCYRN